MAIRLGTDVEFLPLIWIWKNSRGLTRHGVLFDRLPKEGGTHIVCIALLPIIWRVIKVVDNMSRSTLVCFTGMVFALLWKEFTKAFKGN